MVQLERSLLLKFHKVRFSTTQLHICLCKVIQASWYICSLASNPDHSWEKISRKEKRMIILTEGKRAGESVQSGTNGGKVKYWHKGKQLHWRKHPERENFLNPVCYCWCPQILEEAAEDGYIFCVCRRHKTICDWCLPAWQRAKILWDGSHYTVLNLGILQKRAVWLYLPTSHFPVTLSCLL